VDAKFATAFNEPLSNRRGPSSVAHVVFDDDHLRLAFLMKQQAAEEDGEIG